MSRRCAHSLADVLQKHGIWFHVDACHGGQLVFLEAHRNKLRDIQKADFITIDPHKSIHMFVRALQGPECPRHHCNKHRPRQTVGSRRAAAVEHPYIPGQKSRSPAPISQSSGRIWAQ
ncbi:hypothetical protein BOTBODRAFT_459759 [Botryobasidium botryosum FD-172 SS1]|uniref:Uncharacterized protein n=1 Tax=Botryobasidium botryosum (strain FD-172 SS1) TaxID=930990 RepID=A0A067MHP5_BOTB1|nr:hypothetical protein BOTBODRAFT_459759 [Botryobasidium botryosum FD-172 SS1]